MRSAPASHDYLENAQKVSMGKKRERKKKKKKQESKGLQKNSKGNIKVHAEVSVPSHLSLI